MNFTSGLPETACGLGSTLRITKELRRQLPLLLRKLEVKSLVDAPCGDCNWIARCDLFFLQQYIGIDFSIAHLETAFGREWPDILMPERKKFIGGNLLTMDLPKADAILCREFFQHIPTRDVVDFIAKVRRSGYTWMLATSAVSDNPEIGPDMFRPLDLQRAPFLLGEPAERIDDPPGSGRILGAWRL